MRETNAAGSDPAVDPVSLEVSPKTFKELADASVKFVESAGLGESDFMPHLIVHTRSVVEGGGLGDIETTMVAIAAGFSQEQKRETIRNIGRLFYKERKLPAAVFMASEAWTSKEVGPDGKGKYATPSEDPNRQEVLVVSGMSMSGEEKIGVFIPVKRVDGKMARAGENYVSAEIEPYILNHFFRGFFEATARRMGREI